MVIDAVNEGNVSLAVVKMGILWHCVSHRQWWEKNKLWEH